MWIRLAFLLNGFDIVQSTVIVLICTHFLKCFTGPSGMGAYGNSEPKKDAFGRADSGPLSCLPFKRRSGRSQPLYR